MSEGSVARWHNACCKLLTLRLRTFLPMLIPQPANKLGAPPLTPDAMLRMSVHFINQHCEGGAGGALKFVDRLLDWKHQTLIHERARSGMDAMSLRAHRLLTSTFPLCSPLHDMLPSTRCLANPSSTTASRKQSAGSLCSLPKAIRASGANCLSRFRAIRGNSRGRRW